VESKSNAMGDIPVESIDEYEWNANRKLWHLVGCVAMVATFYLWKDLNGTVLNAYVLLGFVWAEVGAAAAIDIMRFYSPRQNEIVKGLPFYGKLMRPIEENHFNATTYYLLAAAILTTSYQLGWCRESTLVISLVVLGVADPAAAWTRYQLQKHRLGHERKLGLLAFLISSALVIWAINEWLDARLSLKCILCIALIVAVIESYTKYWVVLVRPMTRRIQRHIIHHATEWLLWVYPDDNLVIPVAVAILTGLLPQIV